MPGLMDRIREWFSGGRRPMLALSPSAASVLGREIASTQEVEYDCSDVYRLLDQFAEAVLRGEEVSPWMPLIRAHLERCPDCRDEFEALMRILRKAEG
ncbi:MAG: hypothetical protein ACRDG5_07350 [Anaerolineales bacterium]